MNILIESYLVGFKIVCIKSMILRKNTILIIHCTSIYIANSASSKTATCTYFSFIFLSLQFLF